jgi:Xaa-Pro aminopeptidase
VPETSIAQWLKEHAPNGARIGYDPWLHTADWVKQATAQLAAKGAELVAVKRNPIDAVWADRPEPSKARLARPARGIGRQIVGREAPRHGRLAGKEGADAAVLAALDSIAWTFNVRGADVTHTPVALAYAVVNADGTADLFVEGEKVGDDVRAHLGNGVRLHERDQFETYLRSLSGKLVAVDPERSVAAISPGARGRRRAHPQPARPGGAAQGDQE